MNNRSGRACQALLVGAWFLLVASGALAGPRIEEDEAPTAGATPAPDPTPARGYHQHDGFWMRLQLGVGHLSASKAREGQNASYAGMGFTFSAAFGGVVRHNLVLYGELLGTHAADVSVSPANSTDGTAIDLTMIGVGPGITYFFDPYAVYLSGGLTFTAITVSGGGSLIPSPSNSTSSLGIGATVMFGKEWWVSSDWGIGLAAELRLAATARSGLETTVSGSAYSLLVSSTFN